ncbi:response regulator [Pontibacillus sp. HMF3514]|uniref:response regulator n=1 Tax=Pontibacillus sp. HMF3514 TaxID=2692425 RepID=UPI00131FE845|nr:response regulator [Pontibacillus sp. HMF3514]QHE53659.1 response regulator [Pontibacillus sp. HMF3514]
MMKILVVDDERMIRNGIKAMLERRFTDSEILVAADGIEALAFAKEHKLDIVVTDIKMPRMDGIELIENLQDMEWKPFVVILSGYDDFTYAKQAIKYQVMDYLLKPVDRNELFQIIQGAKDKIDARLSLQEDMEEYKSNQLNYLLLNKNVNEEQVKETVQKLQLYPYPNGYFAGIFDFKSSNETLVKEEFFQSIMKQVHQVDNHALCFMDSNADLVVFTEQIDIFDKILEDRHSDIENHLCVAISHKNESIDTLKEAYKQANEALAYKFMFPNQLIFTYEQVEQKQDAFSIDKQLIQKIYNQLGTDRHNEIRASLLSLFNIDEIKDYNICYMEELSQSINTILFDQVFNQIGIEAIEIFKLYDEVGDMYNFDSIHDYFYTVEKLTLRLHDYLKEMKSVYSGESHMEQAIHYIRENAHKDLNMAVVSNHISLNYSYFSHSFKDYTGENFVDYLKKIRIEKAKELLSNMDNKIFEVSESVGFRNPKQFSRVFRDIEGISPKEYREKIKT